MKIIQMLRLLGICMIPMPIIFAIIYNEGLGAFKGLLLLGFAFVCMKEAFYCIYGSSSSSSSGYAYGHGDSHGYGSGSGDGYGFGDGYGKYKVDE